MFKRRIDDLGRIVLPKEIRKELGLAEGDEMDIEIVCGVITISKVLIILLSGLNPLRLTDDGINEDKIEILLQGSDLENCPPLYTIIEKNFCKGLLLDTHLSENRSYEGIKKLVNNLLADGYGIL